jgi:phosphoglycolate phosphatase
MSAKKHIVFDWNGTLLDDIHALHSCTNKLLESEGHAPVDIHAFRSSYDIPFRRFYENFRFTGEQIDKLMSLENSAFHEHYEPLADRAGLRPGAVELFDHAKANGIDMLILSNHLVDPIKAQLRRLEVESYFKAVLAYADRTVQFRDMTKGERLRRFRMNGGGHPPEALIVGDSLEEIDIAREQNLISVAITGGCVSEERLRAAKPDYVIHSLHELKPIMQERGFA